MPSQKWMDQYEALRESLECRTDLDRYFTSARIGRMPVEVLPIGNVNFPTGRIVACDPLMTLEDAVPYLQEIPAGTYPVSLCVVPDKKYGNRYACVKVAVSEKMVLRYELAMTGQERLPDKVRPGAYFGFGVDAGMGCILDAATHEAYMEYWAKRQAAEGDIDNYENLFKDLLAENAKAHPKYQCKLGDWLNWTVPGTDRNMALFASGWGDGCYPVYFGYDAWNQVAAVYILFINIESEYGGD